MPGSRRGSGRDDGARSRRWSRHSARPAAAAATAFAGKASVSLAPGTEAARWTTQISPARSAHAGSARRPHSQDGAPSAPSPPATNASAPAAMAGGTSGTATRLAAGAIKASRPKVSRAIGSVAAWAASETPRLSRRGPGSQGAPASRRRVSGVAHATSPAVAAAESWNPTSPTVAGSATTIAATAHASPTIALEPRPLSTASSATAAITAARTTDGDGPGEERVGHDRGERDDRPAPAADERAAEAPPRSPPRWRCSSRRWPRCG